MMNDEAWLAGLKPGDEVAPGNGNVIETVRGITATQLVVGSFRYNRKTGKRCGSSGWNAVWLHPVTDRLRSKVARSEALAFIRYGLTSETPTGALVEAVAMLKTATEAAKVPK